MTHENTSDFFTAISVAALLLMLFVIFTSKHCKPKQKTFLRLITLVMLIYMISEPVEWWAGDYAETVLHLSAALMFLATLLYYKKNLGN
jgi:membrane-associated HD superfamily phosphohydrolase